MIDRETGNKREAGRNSQGLSQRQRQTQEEYTEKYRDRTQLEGQMEMSAKKWMD